MPYFNTAGLAIAPYEVHQRVHETMLEAARSGEALRDRLDATRDALARFLGAHPDEIALTRNATESMNLVARGLDFKRGDEIVLTTHEHPGGAAPWVALHQDAGVVLRLYDPVFDAERDRAGLLALCRLHQT